MPKPNPDDEKSAFEGTVPAETSASDGGDDDDGK